MTAPVKELAHSAVSHHLARLRSVDTDSAAFRHHIHVLSMVLGVEATRDIPVQPCRVTTPLESVEAWELAGRTAVVPILRAGLGMVEPFLNLLPDAEVRHLGIYRNEETAEPVSYYNKLPDDNPVDAAFVVDPMLATGGSASAVIETLKEWGVKDIRMLAIISAPEGIARLQNEHNDVPIWTCVIDRELDSNKYIRPGLGDAGDRIFRT